MLLVQICWSMTQLNRSVATFSHSTVDRETSRLPVLDKHPFSKTANPSEEIFLLLALMMGWIFQAGVRSTRPKAALTSRDDGEVCVPVEHFQRLSMVSRILTTRWLRKRSLWVKILGWRSEVPASHPCDSSRRE